MKTEQEKAALFEKLHREGCFLIPNPWDRGSARLLEYQGFKALATTGAGFAFSQGVPDLTVGAEQMMDYLRAICSATDLPVSADLQNGFSAVPGEVAKTIVAAAAAGIVGGSIEDASGDPGNPIYELDHAVERIRAAAEAARSLPFRFMLTARAENLLYGRHDLKETIARLQAYQEAGADVLYAPGILSRDEIRSILSSIDRPLNVLMGFQGDNNISLAELAAMGVRRVSIGASLARAAYGALMRAAKEMADSGTFAFADSAVSPKEINGIFSEFEAGRGQNGRS
jgi:2-methylisocitrate lyase-like PEP mutase family enzyme